MLSKIIQYFGVFLIITFSAMSILFTLSIRDIDDPEIKKIMSYTSFFEDRFYDLRMNINLDRTKFDKRIVLAAVDDPSLKEIGRFPWSREVWAQFVDKMRIYGAKIISFDVFFSEDEKACNQASPDIQFADAIKRFRAVPGNEVVLPYSVSKYIEDSYKEIPDTLFNFILDTKENEEGKLKKYFVAKNVLPIQTLIDTESALGHIEVEEDVDGIFRHYPIVSNIDDLYLPSFGLITYQKFTGDKGLLELLGRDQTTLKLKTGDISVNYKGETKVRWMGAAQSFPFLSIKDILKAPDDSVEMREKISGNVIFVGSTAFGAHDLRHTPIDPMLPGIYFHMNMLYMLLEGMYFTHTSNSAMYSWIMLFIGTLLMLLIMRFGNPIIDLFSVIGLSLGLFYYDVYYLVHQGFEIKLFFILFSIIATYSWTTFYHFYLESIEKKKIKGTFASFVAPAIVDQMLSNPDKVKVGGEKKEITVFFSDVRDFTSISEKLTPEELSTCLNIYMGMMTDIVFDTLGTLDKYIGDAMVAFWGAPLDVENHAYHALSASIKMIEKLPEVNEIFKEQGFPLFEHGIGLNTGFCSVGNMGSDKIFSYTALGDNMNLGARLESLCKFYGVQLNISEYTLNAIPDDLRSEFSFRILDKVKVKGKENAVTIYEALHATHPFKLDPESLAKYETAFKDYQGQRFEAAVALLAPLHQKYPQDKSCKRVLEICQNFIKNPPGDDWDGVFVHTSKG